MTGFLSFIPRDLIVTIGLCLLGSFSVAVIMRFFIKPAFRKIDSYMYGKYDETSKALVVFNTCKSVVYLGIAGVLTLYVVHKLMGVAQFPCNNNQELLIFYFIPMFAVQMFLDLNMKKIMYWIFNIKYEEDDNKDEEKQKEKKVKIYKIDGAKYVKDENGQLVPYQEER